MTAPTLPPKAAPAPSATNPPAAEALDRGRPGASGLTPALSLALPILVVVAVAAAWELGVRAAAVPVYILPAPSQVATRLVTHAPALATDGAVTLAEAVLGFAIGCGVSMLAAAVMAHSTLLERSLLPLAILLKVTPIVAIAPLLVIWLGFGTGPKAIVAALITFYPMLINALAGFRAVNAEASDLFTSLAASRWETFRLLRWPSALPYLFAGARVAVPLSLIGAVVGEWAGAERGLGRAVILAYTNLDLPGLFAAVVVLALLGVALTGALGWLERRTLHWADRERL